ncbi:hypothetical protein L202_07804 [Cryptococcus amylolentus CBS 6039]|uniref:Uncharacterized protein n=1 Tax=Cryptococcus amylolentus CBS 6039 TaxID=1295533 RepID=A0A1E3HCT2_9TREE|nr:hypothetical protein L202_07804 [Cryptococcus amylolentus CBS 6039]ODN73251.1 hypothetical protein L202_07804 [Cryptococcus amylolentus CBS 6039]
MPPKKSNLTHVTFHFYRSAVFLSVPSDTKISTLKESLVSALEPFSSTLPVAAPSSPKDIQLWELLEPQEEGGQKEIGNLETGGDEGFGSRSLSALGWGGWKSLVLGFKGEDGTFGTPVYTLPDPDDGDVEAVPEEA